MEKKASVRLGALLALLLGFGLSGATCPNAGPTDIVSPLEGTWHGTMQTTMVITPQGGQSVETTVEADFELTIGASGFPEQLNLPVWGQGGLSGGESYIDVFQTNTERTFSGSMEITTGGTTYTLEWSYTITVTAAEQSATGFRFAYNIEGTSGYTDGPLAGYQSQVAGTATYEATAAGNTLSYEQMLDYNTTSTFPGGETQQMQLEMTGVGTLTRQ
ncbi:MAG: hypothetical protein KKI02_01985 [Planctomycetes bacterium]|nr:hypothetical protein [Planctomycetota bacterium]